MQRIIFSVTLLFLSTLIQSQNLEAYVIYNSKGKEVKYSKMMKSVREADIFFFGELHNNAIAHWFEYEMTQELFMSRELILGAEMFEADNQEALSLYINGKIDEKGLDTTARLWKNYKTDYKPLVDFAKENTIPFIATNIPRTYASIVYRGGFEALDTISSDEKRWIAPMPIIYDPEVACYKNILEMSHGHGGDNLPKAQAIKDATMSHFILSNYEPGKLFVHYNGSYHSENHEGIVWYINKADESLNCITVAIVSQDDVQELEEDYLGTADFIIAVDANMTTTY